MNGIGFIQPLRTNQKDNPDADSQVARIDLFDDNKPSAPPEQEDRPLTVREFRTLLYQFEAEIKQHITIEIAEQLAHAKPSFIRELVSELLGAMDARENFKEYEARRNNPYGEEDFFSEMRRMYGGRGN